MNETQPRKRLFVKITRSTLPQVSDRYPFIYLEHGRLEIDDSSIKWIDSECNLVRIPVASIQAILLGPGTSVTHEAVKVMAASNCTVCWVGEESMLFYGVGQSPTSDTRNLRLQAELSSNPKKRIEVARKMFQRRFDGEDVSGKSLQELMGMEGRRVKRLYELAAEKYKVGWYGRSYVPGKFELSDMTNQILTAANNALYAILTSVVYSMGFSPHLGFVHSGSPLPFVYDLADLYKEHICIDLAFNLTVELAGMYNRYRVMDSFKSRVIETDLLGKVGKDVKALLGI